MMGLTRKQAELLAFIKAHIAANAVVPSLEEMRKSLGLASKSSVQRMVVALEERGCIRRLPNRARSIALIPDRLSPIGGRNVALSTHVYGKAQAAAEKLGIPVDAFVASAVEIMADGGFRT